MNSTKRRQNSVNTNKDCITGEPRCWDDIFYQGSPASLKKAHKGDIVEQIQKPPSEI